MMKIEKIVFWGGLIFGLICHAVTLPYSPVHWQDECQITELGRLLLSPGTDWSMYILPTAVTELGGSGIWSIGRTLQELSYRLGGATAPRWMELFCLMMVAIFVRFYVTKKISSAWLGTVFGLLAFSVPELVQSARGARVDAMAMMFLFAALSAMQLEDCPCGKNRRPLVMVLTGACAALCVWTWATAVMMMPIVLWELVETLRRWRVNMRELLILLGCAIVGGLLISAIDFIPCYESIGGTLARIGNSSKVVGYGQEVGLGKIITQLLGVPGLYIIGFCCLFLHWRMWLLAIFAVLFLHVTKGSIYVFRTLYIMPYTLIGLAMLCGLVHCIGARRILVALAVLMAVIAYGRSVLVRNAVEFLARDYRDERQLRIVLEKEVGRNASVYNYAFQTYYVGRELGWKQYQMFNNALKPDVAKIKDLDCFLIDAKDAGKVSLDDLRLAGFDKQRTITVFPSPVQGVHKWLAQHDRLHPLGDYVLFYRSVSNCLPSSY